MIVQTKINGKMQQELLLGFKVIGLISLILGAIGLTVDIVLEVAEVHSFALLTTFAFALLLVMGIVMVVYNAKLVKQSERINKENLYIFYDEYFEIKTIYHGEVEDKTKLYYSDILKVKETKNYIFIYPDNTKALGIDKKNVPSLEELRKLINKKG